MRTTKLLLLTLIAATTLGCFSAAHADERLWIYTKGAETLPEGRTELVMYNISRVGKVDSDYAFNDIHFEVEYGVTDRLTVFGELMVFNHDYSTSNPDLQPYFDTQGGAGGRFNETQIGGWELGAKYNILSPYKDTIGLSVSAAWDRRIKYRLDGASIDQNAFELTGHFQKNFYNNQLVLAFTPKVEWEKRTSPGILEEEIALDIALGASYRVAPKWFVGAEFRHQSDYLSPYNTETNQYEEPSLDPSKFPFQFGTQHQNGNYFGPTVHYAAKEWWLTGGILWQVSGGGSEFSFNRDGKNWDEHERYHAGIALGLEF